MFMVILTWGGFATYRLVHEAFQTSDAGFLLLAAIKDGDAKFTQELLHKGVDPNFNFNGMTPLKKARDGNHQDIVRLLESAGAKN